MTIRTAAYPNTDLDGAKGTDDTSYYTFKNLDANGNLAGYGYTNSFSCLSNGYGYKMLEDANVSSNVTALDAGHTGTLDMGSHNLTIANGKAIIVNGVLTIKNAGDITGFFILNNVDAAINGPAGLDVGVSESIMNIGGQVEYKNGKYRVVYEVEVSNVKHGTARANVTKAAKGETVELTATLARGYVLRNGAVRIPM